MALFGKGEKNDLRVALSPRKKKLTPIPPAATASTPRKKLFTNWRKALVFLAFVGMLAFLTVFSSPLFRLATTFIRDNSTPGTSVSEASPLEAIVREVGKQYLLPAGETPTLAMVTDLEDIKAQPFFAKAKVGDAILMYLDSKKAILWRPSTKQVIEVGPIAIVEPKSTSTSDSFEGVATST